MTEEDYLDDFPFDDFDLPFDDFDDNDRRQEYISTSFEDIKKNYEPQIFFLMHEGLSYNEAVERLYDELGYSNTYPLEKETA